MKLFTFTIALLLLNVVALAQSSTCPDYFRRNNGNGACADGQIRLYFTTCPGVAPVIDSVYTDGVKSNVSFYSPDASKCSSQGFIAYCVAGGNMPPASVWRIFFHNTGFSNQTGCLVPEAGKTLPIVMQSFFAKRTGTNVSLIWTTAYESNGHVFEIQRKSGNGFITIGTVLATNSPIGSSYNFTDNNNTTAISEYRLKLVSKDAGETFSEIRSVKGIGSSIDFTVYPNPAVRNARVSISDISQSTNVQVIDNAGRVIKTLSIKTNNTIELNNLPTGIYRIRLVNTVSGEAITKTLTVIQ